MSAAILELGVNIDHVATLRQARYRDQPTEGPRRVEPDPVAAALACEAAGCHGITAHLREDRRHIIDRDVRRLREAIRTRLNFEMAITPEIVAFALDVKPDIVCIVPERREEVTTEGGLDVVGQWEAITATCSRMRDAGIATSLFIAPDPAQISAAARAGADAIELHTERYGDLWHLKRGGNDEIQGLVAAARQAHELGLQVNAGHGLNVENLPLIHLVPHLVELNIGHSIVSRAIFIGLDAAVKEMLKAMEGYPG